MDNTDSTESNGQVPTPAEVAAKTTASTAEKSAEVPDTFDCEYVEKLRKEATGYRSKLKELEPLVAEYRKQQVVVMSLFVMVVGGLMMRVWLMATGGILSV